MSTNETSPLLQGTADIRGDEEAVVKDAHEADDSVDGEAFDNVPRAKRQLGTASAMFLIFNRVIGTGIFATPSVILSSAGGSVGVSFLMWIAGAVVAFAGTAVYIELGSGIPRSGGEKNYLEFIYRRPRFLATCVYAVYALFMGWSAANCVVFAEYTLHALSLPPTALLTRAVAFASLTFVFILHSCFLRAGLRLQNFLGAFKLVALVLIAGAGIAHRLGVPGFALRPGVEAPHALDSWATFWAHSEGGRGGWNAAVVGMTNVIWSFIGYSNANYALSEVQNPVRTLKRAAPLAIGLVAAVYLVVNWAYVAVVAKGDILGSGRIVAALFFGNLFGPAAERVLSVVIALSCLGNVLAVMFTQGRLVQECAREGILPPSLSSVLSSNAPFGAPMSGLAWQWIISGLVMVGAPPGDAYLFLLNLSSYPLAVINALVALGLLLLRTGWYQRDPAYTWRPPFSAWKWAVAFFLAANILLVVVPLVPPEKGARMYEGPMPYWAHVVVAYAISIFGIAYWYIWSIWLPRRGGYALRRQWIVQADGIGRRVFGKVDEGDAEIAEAEEIEE